jgi:hypothetical protein
VVLCVALWYRKWRGAACLPDGPDIWRDDSECHEPPPRRAIWRRVSVNDSDVNADTPPPPPCYYWSADPESNKLRKPAVEEGTELKKLMRKEGFPDSWQVVAKAYLDKVDKVERALALYDLDTAHEAMGQSHRQFLAKPKQRGRRSSIPIQDKREPREPLLRPSVIN